MQDSHSMCCGCTECTTGKRNNYFEGKRLSIDSYRVEQRYGMDRRRLLNCSIHGTGVVYGYEVKADSQTGALEIGPGLALDDCGRELMLDKSRTLSMKDVTLVDDNGCPLSGEEAHEQFKKAAECVNGKPVWRFVLAVNYAERDMERIPVTDACNCTHDFWNYACETVHFTLHLVEATACCHDHDSSLDCQCADATTPCCGDEQGPTAHGRGGCRCLCEHVTQWTPADKCDCYRTERSGDTRFRMYQGHGVPLACVDLVQDGSAFGPDVDACGPRPLVKSNELLFDLIRGRDLTRITEIGWKEWHRSTDGISLDEFSTAMGWDSSKPNEKQYTSTKFTITFSRTVRRATLGPDCFDMTIIVDEPDDGWWKTRRVPIVDIKTEPDTDELTTQAAIVVDGGWLREIAEPYRKNILLNRQTRVEFSIRGDFILDCNGQAVDANAVGLQGIPSGNGTPGGTFLSTFLINDPNT